MSSYGQQSLAQKRSMGKPACTTCARRKVKCNREEPACSNCVKYQVECRYEEPAPPQRHTKRRADAELQARLSHLEQLLQQRGIDPETGETTTSERESSYQAEKQPVLHDKTRTSKPQLTSRPNSMAKHPLLPLDGPSCVKFMRRRYHAPSSPSMASYVPLSSSSDFLAMHPEPGQVFRLWQIFAERTNPMTKIIHAPSMQQRILDSGWNMSQCSNSFQALLFAVYLLAVVSLSPDKCLQHFGEERNTLMSRYGDSTWSSLLAANVFETRELEVLQALVLFILSDPASDTATTLSAVAVRIALKMGLDQEEAPTGTKALNLFETEMRVRLWWQICTHDVLARHLFSSRESQGGSLITPNIRLPLNVNDAELHPDMVKQPIEHPRASEMVYVLMKYEGSAWGQRNRFRRQPADRTRQEISVQTSPVLAERGIQFSERPPEEPMNFNFHELERLLEDKYLRHCDPRIPLHAAAQTMSRSSICVIHYMRTRIKAGGVMPTDSLFDQALQVLELDKSNKELPFTRQLLWHGGPIQLDAVVHVLIKLKQPLKGDRASKAWDLVVDFWIEQIDGDWNEDDTFFADLLDLTLEAWHERRKELAEIYGPQVAEGQTPSCIKRLQEIRTTRDAHQEGVSGASTADYLLDSTTNLSSMSQPTFDINTMAMPEDWFAFFNNEMFYNYGYWSDFSLL